MGTSALCDAETRRLPAFGVCVCLSALLLFGDVGAVGLARGFSARSKVRRAQASGK